MKDKKGGITRSVLKSDGFFLEGISRDLKNLCCLTFITFYLFNHDGLMVALFIAGITKT